MIILVHIPLHVVSILCDVTRDHTYNMLAMWKDLTLSNYNRIDTKQYKKGFEGILCGKEDMSILCEKK